MARLVPALSGPLSALTLLPALPPCGGGRTAPATPAPAPAKAGATAATARAMPVPVLESFEQAVARDTRTRAGVPGPRYWQQWADYKLEAELNPVSKRLTGTGAITYYNR